MVEIEAGSGMRPGLATLEPSDATLAREMFGRLSPRSIYSRFFSPITRPDLLQASVRQIDHTDREAVGAVVQGAIVGIAQFVRRGAGNRAQMAIVIEDGWQRQGLATRLVAALAHRALAEGIECFEVDIQGDNYAALRLFRRIAPGSHLKFSSGVGEGVIPLT